MNSMQPELRVLDLREMAITQWISPRHVVVLAFDSSEASFWPVVLVLRNRQEGSSSAILLSSKELKQRLSTTVLLESRQLFTKGNREESLVLYVSYGALGAVDAKRQCDFWQSTIAQQCPRPVTAIFGCNNERSIACGSEDV